jgi:DNA-binding LytR/AlgR family response regulator
MPSPKPVRQSLRIFCVEDNPLIILHMEMLIQELGHLFVGSSDSFSDLRRRIDALDFDVALVDIDLADGRTGGEVASWLLARNCPSIFVTGQEQLAADYANVSAGLIIKPVTLSLLADKLNAIRLAGP